MSEAPSAPSLTITQPIQVSRAAEELPLAKGAVPGGAPLPRLDVSLAGQETVASAPTPLTEPTRTRVYLPRPGSADAPARPEDFLAPSAPPSAPETAPRPAPEAGPTLEDFEDLAQTEVPAMESGFSRGDQHPEMAPISLDDLEEPVKSDEASFLPAVERPVETFPPTAETPPPVAEAPEPEAPVEEELGDPLLDLPEWQVPEPSPPVPPSIDSPPEPAPPSLASAPPPLDSSMDEDFLDGLPLHPLHEGSFGKLLAQNPADPAPESAVSPPPMPAGPTPSSDRMDASFERMMADADPAPAGGSKATLIAMVAAIVIVAIVATVGIILVVNSFGGGWDPAEDYAKQAESEPDASSAKKSAVSMPRIPTSSETANAPDLSQEDAPAVIDAPAISRDEAARPAPGDAPAMSFDEKASQAVNATRGASVIGAPSLDLVESPLGDFTRAQGAGAAPTESETTPPAAEPSSPVPSSEEAPPGDDPAAKSASPMAKSDPNYNPPDSFAAPGPDDKSTLGKTHDVIDAFLRAPDPATRVKYTYNGDSLRPAIEDYHQKWPYQRFGRYSLQLYQIETDATLGGPYWVFIVSTSDSEEGFPLIVRIESGLLKVDWEIFAEFSDRHFLRFRDGTMTPPATFRLIIERFSDYYGSDRDAFEDLGDHYVYQVNPPYGDLNEFSEFVFVKKDSAVAQELDALVKLGDDPLAVVVALDQKPFAHGVKHIVVTELVTEGWFR